MYRMRIIPTNRANSCRANTCATPGFSSNAPQLDSYINMMKYSRYVPNHFQNLFDSSLILSLPIFQISWRSTHNALSC